ncbi:twin-arginine translocation signal domain-containing protein, partial [Escherichia coli]
MKSSQSKTSQSRRRFLRDTVRTAAGVGAAACVLGLQSLQSQARETKGVPIR